MSRNYTIQTWADGFGRWHARITFTGGAATYSKRIDKGIAAGKRAIRTEINARTNQRDYRLSYHEVSSLEDAGIIYNIVIAEGRN